MANLLPPPEKLDLEGDNATVAVRWEKWKRSLNIYLEASAIADDSRKRATLLLLGGPGLQEIIYNTPGAMVKQADGVDVFEIAIEKLDSYFQPKQNKIYERYIFRQIKQEDGERFEKFIIKLRNQAEKCKFTNPDEHLIDQIVEKCSASELRKKILTLGDDATLDMIIMEANTLEVVGQQLNGYEQKKQMNDINRISHFSRGSRLEKEDTLEYRDGNKSKDVTCGLCGYAAHIASNQECPAKRKKCHSCGKVGHFAALCRNKLGKRKIEQKQSDYNYNKRPKNRRDVNQITTQEKEDVYYVF